jgi:diadenylate cyclase
MVLAELAELSALDLLDLPQVARAMGLPSTPEAQDAAVSPRGYRMLARVPRIPPSLLEAIVEQFGSLQKLLAASVEELQAVDGVGEARARAIREGISRLAEVSIIDRFS